MDGPGDQERSLGPSPALVAIGLWLACFAATALVLTGMGFLITSSPLHGPIDRWDISVTTWFAAHATPTLDAATRVGSDLGMTTVVIGLATVFVVTLWFRNQRRDAGFIVAALSIEAAVALLVSFVVDRPRPSLIRLESIPPTRSFPSGHTAASIALYVGAAIVISPHVHSRLVRAVLWIVAIALPVYVGVSRVYRGMHHATDVLGSLLLGCLALASAWLVVRATASAWRRRHAGPPAEPNSVAPVPTEVGL
jgi:membrane-associated phospholipid phosphatase